MLDMSIGSVCVVIRRAPYGREDAFSGLRLALSGITHGMEFSVVLRGDGVWSALRGQRAEAIAMPSNESVVSDILEMGGTVHAEEGALATRGIARGDLVEGVVVTPAAQLDELVLRHDAATPVWGGF
jgi:sulfur relay (sulfurtransferase) DsrF/TusC family protein